MSWLMVVVLILPSTSIYGQTFRQLVMEALERLTASPAATAAERQALNRAKVLVSAGQIDDAARLLEQQAARMRVASIPVPAADRLQTLSEALASRSSRPLGALHIPVREPAVGSRLVAFAAGLSPSQTSMFASLSAVSGQPLKMPRWVQASVRQFGREFLNGARDPGRYLNELLRSVPAEKRWRVEEWLRSTNRHFVIAPNADAAGVEGLRAAVAREGGAAFFYQDCIAILGRLCSAETVGAFFALSQETVVSRSGAASAYIPVELMAAIRFHQGQDEIWLMVTPQDVQAAIAGAATGVSVVVIETPSA